MTLSIICLMAAYIVSAQQNENIFSYHVGEYKITLLSEGQGSGNTEILIGATQEMINDYTKDGSFPIATNAFLIQTPDKNILIDTGYGKALPNNLKSLGLDGNKIDAILLTHMHGDHIGGLLHEGEILFPNAFIYIPQPEYDYWMSDKEMNQLPENRRGGFLNARKVVEAYKEKIQLFEPHKAGDVYSPLLSGISPIAGYGHTPGHTLFEIESKGEKILVWGDLTHAMAIQMPYPKVAVTYDVNPELAIKYRLEILKYVTKNNIPIAGMHITYPAMGQIVELKNGYEFKPFQ